jgi:quercetin dioxygenase-like cupin family protein
MHYFIQNFQVSARKAWEKKVAKKVEKDQILRLSYTEIWMIPIEPETYIDTHYHTCVTVITAFKGTITILILPNLPHEKIETFNLKEGESYELPPNAKKSISSSEEAVVRIVITDKNADCYWARN